MSKKGELMKKLLEKESIVILLLQVLLVLMLLIPFFQFFIGIIAVSIVEMLLIAFFSFLLFECKKLFEKNFHKILVFFSVIAVIIQASWMVNAFFPEKNLKPEINFFLLILLIAFFVLFKLFNVKNFVVGRVLSSDGKITIVETSFDFFSSTKKGKHVIETTKIFKKGEKVKLKVVKSFFGKTSYKIID
jgi:uncharacterized membrane protein